MRGFGAVKSILIGLSLFYAVPAWAAQHNFDLGKFDHSQWDMLLKTHVEMADDGTSSTVNYAQFKKDRTSLKSYLDALGGIDQETFDSWPKEEQLAFLINSYNAWTVELILRNYPGINSIHEAGTFWTSPWQKRFITILGEMHTLDDIEHGMIRSSGRYNDPRIHFAVNCASIGCPALIDQAFDGANLNDQLERTTRAFLVDRSRNKTDAEGLAVSSLFTWYRGDFEAGWRGAHHLEDFLALYGNSLKLSDTQTEALKTGQINIRFLDYDWRLNDSNIPAAGVSTGYLSPIWLARSFPLPAAMIIIFILLLLYGLLHLIQRTRQNRKPARI